MDDETTSAMIAASDQPEHKIGKATITNEVMTSNQVIVAGLNQIFARKAFQEALTKANENYQTQVKSGTEPPQLSKDDDLTITPDIPASSNFASDFEKTAAENKALTIKIENKAKSLADIARFAEELVTYDAKGNPKLVDDSDIKKVEAKLIPLIIPFLPLVSQESETDRDFDFTQTTLFRNLLTPVEAHNLELYEAEAAQLFDDPEFARNSEKHRAKIDYCVDALKIGARTAEKRVELIDKLSSKEGRKSEEDTRILQQIVERLEDSLKEFTRKSQGQEGKGDKAEILEFAISSTKKAIALYKALQTLDISDKRVSELELATVNVPAHKKKLTELDSYLKKCETAIYAINSSPLSTAENQRHLTTLEAHTGFTATNHAGSISGQAGDIRRQVTEKITNLKAALRDSTSSLHELDKVKATRLDAKYLRNFFEAIRDSRYLEIARINKIVFTTLADCEHKDKCPPAINLYMGNIPDFIPNNPNNPFWRALNYLDESKERRSRSGLLTDLSTTRALVRFFGDSDAEAVKNIRFCLRNARDMFPILDKGITNPFNEGADEYRGLKFLAGITLLIVCYDSPDSFQSKDGHPIVWRDSRGNFHVNTATMREYNNTNATSQGTNFTVEARGYLEEFYKGSGFHRPSWFWPSYYLPEGTLGLKHDNKNGSASKNKLSKEPTFLDKLLDTNFMQYKLQRAIDFGKTTAAVLIPTGLFVAAPVIAGAGLVGGLIGTAATAVTLYSAYNSKLTTFEGFAEGSDIAKSSLAKRWVGYTNLFRSGLYAPVIKYYPDMSPPTEKEKAADKDQNQSGKGGWLNGRTVEVLSHVISPLTSAVGYSILRTKQDLNKQAGTAKKDDDKKPSAVGMFFQKLSVRLGLVGVVGGISAVAAGQAQRNDIDQAPPSWGNTALHWAATPANVAHYLGEVASKTPYVGWVAKLQNKGIDACRELGSGMTVTDLQSEAPKTTGTTEKKVPKGSALNSTGYDDSTLQLSPNSGGHTKGQTAPKTGTDHLKQTGEGAFKGKW